jgi:hypothetical protein
VSTTADTDAPICFLSQYCPSKEVNSPARNSRKKVTLTHPAPSPALPSDFMKNKKAVFILRWLQNTALPNPDPILPSKGHKEGD